MITNDQTNLEFHLNRISSDVLNMTFRGFEFHYNKLSSSYDDAPFYCDGSLLMLSITDYILFPYIQINCNHTDQDTDQTKQTIYVNTSDCDICGKIRLTYLPRDSPSPTPACLFVTSLLYQHQPTAQSRVTGYIIICTIPHNPVLRFNLSQLSDSFRNICHLIV